MVTSGGLSALSSRGPSIYGVQHLQGKLSIAQRPVTSTCRQSAGFQLRISECLVISGDGQRGTLPHPEALALETFPLMRFFLNQQCVVRVFYALRQNSFRVTRTPAMKILAKDA